MGKGDYRRVGGGGKGRPNRHSKPSFRAEERKLPGFSLEDLPLPSHSQARSPVISPVPNRTFDLVLNGKYPTLTFHGTAGSISMSPFAVWFSDPVLTIAKLLRDALQSNVPAHADLFDEPGTWRVELSPRDQHARCTIHFDRRIIATSFEGPPVFEDDFDLRRLARDVAKSIKDWAQVSEHVAPDTIKAADLILDVLRGDAPSPWSQ